MQVIEKIKKGITNLDNIFLIIILLGFFIRIYLSFLPGFKFDIGTWFAWAIRLNEVGLSQFYSDQIWTNYTPGYLYILKILGFLKNLLKFPDQIFYLILKLPAIFSEIILGYFIYCLVRKNYSIFTARFSAALVLLNPAFIFNSAVWGQIDGLLTLFMLLTIYYLNKKRSILSSIFLGLAFLIKPQAIAILPVVVLILIKKFSVTNLLKLSLPTILIVFLLSLPFFVSTPIRGILELILKMISDYSYTSAFAYNLWGIVGFWISDSDQWFSFSYQSFGLILLGIFWLIVLFTHKGLSIYSLAALATLSFFFLPTRVHERYLYPALIFLILCLPQIKSKIFLVALIVLNLIHLLNLYHVYVYYNELYLNSAKILYNAILYSLLEAQTKILSLISTILFVIITFYIIKNKDVSKN
ncbi:glycosyltransferase family 39 protein [Candidatus Daviesbacteria bacterium]|nr:glycosyltransferase family 39 protein [Candidatus Daviesbacteria bacterium]